MLSVYVVRWIFLQTFQTYFCIQANSVDPDQTAPKKWLLKSQADDKADDNSCDWHFKVKTKYYLSQEAWASLRPSFLWKLILVVTVYTPDGSTWRYCRSWQV